MREYFPAGRREFEDKLGDDWLMDMKRYSGEFRTDLIPMWMDEMELPFNFAPAHAPPITFM